MKEARLADSIGNIASEFIDEAAVYQKVNHKRWYKWAIAASLILLIAFSWGNKFSSKIGSKSMADMVGLVIYQGNTYTQTSRYIGEEALAIKGLLAEKLGYATGNINEWSSKAAYKQEFASVNAGDVYAVTGYSTKFRLAMQGEITDEFGKVEPYVEFYEYFDQADLTTGRELFGDRLLLVENMVSIQYQSHHNWDYGKSIYEDLTGVTSEQLTAFIDALYANKLQNMYESNRQFYADDKQAHLIVHMKDNTIVELRLIEGGYVGYQHWGWHFVKLSPEVFDVMFQAIK